MHKAKTNLLCFNLVKHLFLAIITRNRQSQSYDFFDSNFDSDFWHFSRNWHDFWLCVTFFVTFWLLLSLPGFLLFFPSTFWVFLRCSIFLCRLLLWLSDYYYEFLIFYVIFLDFSVFEIFWVSKEMS